MLLLFLLIPPLGFGSVVDEAGTAARIARRRTDAQRKLAVPGLLDEIAAAFERVSRLRYMGDEEHRLLARGEFVSSRDDILRRREPAEILASGLSSGCGDNAAAFYGLMRRHGLHLRYIDSVDLSMASLENRFDGHTGVAVQDPLTKHWILTDPTPRASIISMNWDPSSTYYVNGPGRRRWIWYRGRWEDYPAKNSRQLKKIFDEVLKRIPADVFDREIIRLEFDAGSFHLRDGSFANPDYPGFLAYWEGLYQKYGVHPARSAHIQFVDGGSGDALSLRRTSQDSWRCVLGRDYPIMRRWNGYELFNFIEWRVKGEFETPFKSGRPRAEPRS